MLWWSMSNCISFLPKPPVFILRVTILEKVSACIWIDMIESYIYIYLYICPFMCSLSLSLYVSRPSVRTSYRAIFRMACAWGQDDSRDNSGAAQIRYRSLQRWHGNYLVTLVEFPRHLFHIEWSFQTKSTGVARAIPGMLSSGRCRKLPSRSVWRNFLHS